MVQLRRSSDWLSTVASRIPELVTTQARRTTGPRDADGGFRGKAAVAAANRANAMQESRAFMQTSWTLAVGTPRAREVPLAIEPLLLRLGARRLAFGGLGLARLLGFG